MCLRIYDGKSSNVFRMTRCIKLQIGSRRKLWIVRSGLGVTFEESELHPPMLRVVYVRARVHLYVSSASRVTLRVKLQVESRVRNSVAKL